MKINYNKNNSDLRITIFPRKFLLKFYDLEELKDLEFFVREDYAKKQLVISFKKTRGDS